MSAIPSIQGNSAAVQPQAIQKRQPAPAAPAETATQEAQESFAVTRTEAGQGDAQAIRKLAQSQAPAPKPGSVNLLA